MDEQDIREEEEVIVNPLLQACNKSLKILEQFEQKPEELIRYIIIQVAQQSIDRDYIVTVNDLEYYALLVSRVNMIPGPIVKYDPKRGYGLFAEKDYKPQEVVTTYGGKHYYDNKGNGPYFAFFERGNIHIDGYKQFKLSEKGRWINQFDEQNKKNVQLAVQIRTIKSVKKGEQFFAYYGKNYDSSKY